MPTPTKQILSLVMGLILLTLTQCKKDIKVCGGYTELSGQAHLVDLNALKDVPPFLDTLAKYPQLRVYEVINDPYMYGMHCHVFYKGLQLMNHNYALFKSKSENFIYGIDTIAEGINMATTPNIQFEEAIGIGKRNMNFENACISYQLGIYDLGDTQTSNRYTLVWKIQDEYGSRYVILDANSGQVYRKEDGIRY
jgi:hypothetical protein